MSRIELIVPARPRRWQRLVVERLDAAGHELGITPIDEPRPLSPLLDLALGLERRLLRRADALAGMVDPLPARSLASPPDLVIDLTGHAPGAGRVQLTFEDTPAIAGTVAALIDGRPTRLAIVRDGQVLRRATPMREQPASVALSLEHALARAVTLLVAVASDPDWHPDRAPAPPLQSVGPLLPGLLFRGWPRLIGEVRRRARYRLAHWRVGYRLVDGPGVAETGTLVGAPWSVLPDDGTHFYADPFPISVEGNDYLFVEDFPHATGKAVISVVAFDGAGMPSPPRLVLEEPHHLSYPQVFARQGGIFMLPEASGGHTLTLYRATAFPDAWQPYVELISGRQISDATLLERDGRHWLFATDKDGLGSTSDVLVVYSAPRLEGPWTPHRHNPILIDCAAARPGGAVVAVDGRLLLPVQDGTRGYGEGLGLSEIVRLDDEAVVLAPPVPITGTDAWPYPSIHTLNRAGRLEVIDGIAAVPRR